MNRHEGKPRLVPAVERASRILDLVATEPSRFLSIGVEEFRAVIANDAAFALSLLQDMARHLEGTTELLQMTGVNLADFAHRQGMPESGPEGDDHG